MFDGSFRTNKREINYAGASASAKSTRSSHLNSARQQRLARAQAKAKLGAVKVLQRCWRGVREGSWGGDGGGCTWGRKGVAGWLDRRFQDAELTLTLGASINNTSEVTSIMTKYQPRISKAASILAIRLSPPLLPFFASNKNRTGDASLSDQTSEECIRRDLLSLDSLLRPCYNIPSLDGTKFIVSPIAARRLVGVILVLLRQSFHFGLSSNTANKTTTACNGTREIDNCRLVELLNYLLESFFVPGGDWAKDGSADDLWTLRPSDYYMEMILSRGDDGGNAMGGGEAEGGRMLINLFLCFRDCCMLGCTNGEDSSFMDTDESTATLVEMQQMLLKWCCRVVLHLTTVENHGCNSQGGIVPIKYQQGLALLASILFSTDGLSSMSTLPWIDEQLTGCLASVEQYLRTKSFNRTTPTATSPSSLVWSPLLIHYLSTAISAMSNVSMPKSSGKSRNRKILGLRRSFAPCAETKRSNDSVEDVNDGLGGWLGAISDSIATREVVVLDRVFSCADECKKQQKQQQQLFSWAIPIMLQYTLVHQKSLATLASFAARGDNIVTWALSKRETQTDSATMVPDTVTAAVKVFDAEESDDDSQDESDITGQSRLQSSSTRRDNTTTGRYSRADLQTTPKLDVLYQNLSLQAKKAVLDSMCSLTQMEVQQLLSVATKVGKGDMMQQLSVVLIPSASQPPSDALSLLLAPFSQSSMLTQARDAYAGTLSVLMRACSGLKAGRNAASPLLARIAFQDDLVHRLWEVASTKAPLVSSIPLQPSSVSSTNAHSEMASACEAVVVLCDVFSHTLLTLQDSQFLEYYANDETTKASSSRIVASELVLTLKYILSDLYWDRPVLATDISAHASVQKSCPETEVRFQRARLLLSGTKLWNALYERWCRLFRSGQFCSEESWWFPRLASRGQHDNNPIIHSQTTTVGQDDNEDDMDESSIASVAMDEEEDVARAASSAAANDAGSDALASSFRDPKMARVLTCIPQALNFDRRVHLFQSLLESDKARTQDEAASFQQMMMNEEGGFSARERVTIRRDALYTDSLNSLNPLGKRLRKKVQVTFVNKHGMEEAGIDGGGVQKEFFDELIKDAFLPREVKEEEEGDAAIEQHPDFFVETPLQTLQVNAALDGSNDLLRNYEFLGRVLAKAMYEGILVDPQFCLPFLNKLLGKQNSLDDLCNLDPEYYRNLKSLRYMNANEIRELGLTFETTSQGSKIVELISGGSTTNVTKENVIQYIHLVSHQRMNVSGSRQTAAFLRGFRDVIPAPWVRLFSAYEFQKLISGDDAVKGYGTSRSVGCSAILLYYECLTLLFLSYTHRIDVRGMMSVMRYSGGFHPSQPIIHWLWEVVDEMDPTQQRKFLKFMTSCSRQPLLGFASLVPAPCIQQTRLREDNTGNDISEESSFGNIRLPTSSTCMNLLKLPKYTSKEMLREKLIYAIESAAGFELS